MSIKPKSFNPNAIDPSVYHYDEDYDDMKNEEILTKQATKDEKRGSKQGSKYIKGLFETANERKSDKEVRKFKKYARDREEAEVRGELGETEIFITSAYKRRLDEIKKIDADNKRRSEREEQRKLNFTRVGKHYSETHDRKRQHLETGDDTELAREKVYTATEPNDTWKHSSSQRRHPKTVEERKKYLREILAKRTVGEVFEAALERYKNRKQQL